MDDPRRAIFLREIRNQARYALIAANEIEFHYKDLMKHAHQMNDDFEPPRADYAKMRLWASIYSYLGAVGVVANLAWSSGRKPKGEKAEVDVIMEKRTAFKAAFRADIDLDDSSVLHLRGREVRNAYEHFDERVLEWIEQSPEGTSPGYIDGNIGPTRLMAALSVDALNFKRNFDPESRVIMFMGGCLEIPRFKTPYPTGHLCRQSDHPGPTQRDGGFLFSMKKKRATPKVARARSVDHRSGGPILRLDCISTALAFNRTNIVEHRGGLMSTATDSPPIVLEDKIIDLNADQFLGAVDAGIFPAGSRLYLWDGRVVGKRTPDGLEDRIVDLTADQFLGMVEAGLFPTRAGSTSGAGGSSRRWRRSIPHALTTRRVSHVVGAILPADWMLDREDPVQLDDRHVPLPRHHDHPRSVRPLRARAPAPDRGRCGPRHRNRLLQSRQGSGTPGKDGPERSTLVLGPGCCRQASC